MVQQKFSVVVCGGTFDHFHKGHREFLRYCLSISKKILVGLTSDKYVKTKNNEAQTENYKLRKQQLEAFLKKEKALNRILIEPIDDIFIPKTWEKLPIESIVVTKDTILGAEKINLKRIEQGKDPLKIEVSPTVKSNDNGYISSSRIRNGEINRKGEPYISPLWLRKKLLITEKLRTVLEKPFGIIVRSDVILARRCQTVPPRPESPTKNRDAGQASMTYSCIITVGDVTTKTFNRLHLNQDISIIDFKVARKKKFSNLTELGFSGKEKIVKIVNPPGCLTPALFKAASLVFELRKKYDRVIIAVDGEEDLSVLPLILAAPLGSVIFYGQPREGIVTVDVSEETKMRAYYLVSSFKRK